MSSSLHVIFGAGQVGVPLAERLLERGMSVRMVKRSPSDDVPDGAELGLGDASDAEFCREASQGADAIYHIMNPRYVAKVWRERLPLYMQNLMQAAASAEARLVVLDNLYMIGPTGGVPIDEDTPVSPCSAKGRARARAARMLFDAHERGDVRAVVGRASDYYGPRGTLTHLGDPFWKPVLAGKTARMVIDPDAVHTYHYIPDVAAGLAELGLASESVLGRVWMLPCAPARTARELIADLSTALGREIAVSRTPRPVIKALGLFVPMLREVDEMLYQWDEPFIVDDSRFRKRFGATATDPVEGAAATVAWAREHYA